MAFNPSLVPLAGFVGLISVAAFEDLRRLVIPNSVVAGLCMLWPFHLATAPSVTFTGSLGAAGCAAAVLVAGALLFSRGLMGGGDVKLLAVVALWAGPEWTPALLVLTALLGGVLSLVQLLPMTLRAFLPPGIGGIARAHAATVPYGVAIAAAALVVIIPPNLN